MAAGRSSKLRRDLVEVFQPVTGGTTQGRHRDGDVGDNHLGRWGRVKVLTK
jgi:hypothetical protein